MVNKLGGRKIILGFVVLVIGIAVDLLAGKGLSANLLQLLQFIGVGFFLGNGIEHMAAAVKDRQVVQPFDSGKVEAKMDQIYKAQEVLNEQVSVTQQQASYIIKAAGLDKPKVSDDK
ncbi:MAG: hypothetical protein KAS32_00865 [Candidatus Peribacteraceae bacterium]|nr:hypothetical protein [Candidatus Peribacteraceae bacterium]